MGAQLSHSNRRDRIVRSVGNVLARGRWLNAVKIALRFVATVQPKSASMTRCPAIEAPERDSASITIARIGQDFATLVGRERLQCSKIVYHSRTRRVDLSSLQGALKILAKADAVRPA